MMVLCNSSNIIEDDDRRSGLPIAALDVEEYENSSIE
jgi:hypothetical protein